MTKLYRHYNLNAKQIRVLELTYKFRFITSSLLAQYKGLKSRHSAYRRLENLYSQGYLGKRQERNDHFQNKGSRYYLTPKALIYLRDNRRLSEPALHSMYKNKSIGSAFIDHAIDILRAYLSLRSSYPDVFYIFTAAELSSYDYFPSPKPDLYLNRVKYQKGTNEFMFYLEHDNPSFVTKKRFDKLLEHFDSGEWEAELGTPYPTILFVLGDSGSERRIQHYITDKLSDAGIDDLACYTTTVKALLNSQNTNAQILSSVNQPEKLISL